MDGGDRYHARVYNITTRVGGRCWGVGRCEGQTRHEKGARPEGPAPAFQVVWSTLQRSP